VQGDTIWTKTFGGYHQDQAYDVKQTSDGGYVLTGYSYSYHVGLADIYLVKTDANGIVTRTSHNVHQLIQDYILYQNYPNPFNSLTNISFSLTKTSQVKIAVFDITGHIVAEISQGRKQAGFHTVNWDASNYSSGIYFIKIQTYEFSDIKKCILIK
jgi:hypothetical protein